MVHRINICIHTSWAVLEGGKCPHCPDDVDMLLMWWEEASPLGGRVSQGAAPGSNLTQVLNCGTMKVVQ
jgi:hypothetical protein